MAQKDTVTLTHCGIELIILPAIGGRIVSARHLEGRSVIKSDSAQWDGKTKPTVDGEADFVAFNGHINWVGPQSAWWLHQNENAARKADAANWPPDPYLIYGEYTVAHQTERSIVLEGVHSPVSGITFVKEIGINDDSSVSLRVTMHNTGDSPVSWDIWYNTRMDGYSQMYVPVANVDSCRVVPVVNDSSGSMPTTTSAGFFSYLPIMPEETMRERSSKAYIYPSHPYMAAFTDDSLIIYQFELHAPESIHPEQALVEIYCHTEADAKDSLLEMEYHTQVFNLAPGEKCEAFQLWHIFPYSGGDSRLEHITYLCDAAEELSLNF